MLWVFRVFQIQKVPNEINLNAEYSKKSKY